jgi:hypothetical protein
MVSEPRALEYRPGDSIGHLRVEALLGEGGAGAVYRVRDERKGGRLALKQLRAPDDEHKALLTSQFAREYHTLSQLAHPRIIEVHDYGVDRGCPYYTMELLDGEDLHDRGKLPYKTACALLCDVASSLAMLHSRGLIHRDVSARNVRCTGDGRAKLLDFGAMVPAGSIQRAVGTPPFAAPEVLQMQALDGRTDLYGLGALAYWTLTGRHAYGVQTFDQLRDAWRKPPRKVSELAPELPEALVELVMSLLRLDRDERPRTAAEVMERLSGIAGLAKQELPQVGRAYLITPSLVGRDLMLQEARGALLRVLQTGSGTSLLIEGVPGVGGSRFLDACVLEAKLMGAVVLRGTPADASQGAYGVARALLEQLLEACPELCEQAAHPRAALLVHVLPALAPQVAAVGTVERRHLQAALRDFFLSVTRSKHVVIAVDEVGAIDEPSAALLGALAHGTQRRRLSLLSTAVRDEQTTQALGVLRELSQRIVLGPLDAGQTEDLLRSLFGHSPRIAALSARLYGLSGGNPRELMALAEHLVDQGLVRYEAGSWTLPLELSDKQLPRSDKEASERRIAGLSQDARELGEALSLTDVRGLSLPHYPLLTEHGDTGRTFSALDELVRAGILVAETDRYRLTRSDALAPLSAALGQERACTLHARLARVLPVEGRTAARLLHMLRGGQEEAAIAALLSGPPDELYPGRLDALVVAAEAAERLALRMLTKLELHYRIARLSGVAARPELFEQYGWPLIERLRQDSGLRDYHALDASLGEAGRLAESFRRAQERYDAEPSEAQGLPPRESMLRLVALHGTCTSIAGIAQDLEQLERLGSLEPWVNLSRTIRLTQMNVEAAKAVQMDRTISAIRIWEDILRQIEEPEGLNPAIVKMMRLGLTGAVATMRAFHADPSCEASIVKLDAEPGYRAAAWRYRMLYKVARGEHEGARDYERRAELLDLQDAGGLPRLDTLAFGEFLLHQAADDLTGVKRVAERIERCARVFPSWRVVESVAHADYLRLQGDATAALSALEPVLDHSVPGRHLSWGVTRYTHLRLLLTLGRTEEAAQLGVRYLDDAARCAIQTFGFKGVVAEALAGAGRFEEATRVADEYLAELHAGGIRSVWLGVGYEARAWVAIAMRDARTFNVCAEHCGELYLHGCSPGLRARHERLRNAAAQARLIATDRADPGRDEPAAQPSADDEARTVYSRMLTCVSPVERAERALQLLLEATGARTGYFFGLRSGKLQLLFNPEQDPPTKALTDMLEASLERELGDFAPGPSTSNAAIVAHPIAAPLGSFIDDSGREFEPLVLAGTHHGEAMIAGVAALHYPEDDRPPARRAMLDAVIEALIADAVVDPITCVT